MSRPFETMRPMTEAAALGRGIDRAGLTVVGAMSLALVLPQFMDRLAAFSLAALLVAFFLVRER